MTIMTPIEDLPVSFLVTPRKHRFCNRGARAMRPAPDQKNARAHHG